MNTSGELYFRSNLDLPDVLPKGVEHFKARHGVKPGRLIIRDIEVSQGDMDVAKALGLTVELVRNGVQPKHFILYPSLHRTPSIFTGVRRPL